MKVIIFGMGNFGSSLAIQMAEMGHEIIAIDYDMQKVEMVKDKVTHTICLDSTNMNALKSLPLNDTDIVVIAIGEILPGKIQRCIISPTSTNCPCGACSC